jgi:hypothetical protein
VPICPQKCAKSLSATKVTTREEINAPPDIWENLTSKDYTIWQCGCGFVWGERLMEGLGRPYYDRSAVGYYNGPAAHPEWILATHVKLAKNPNWDNLKRR